MLAFESEPCSNRLKLLKIVVWSVRVVELGIPFQKFWFQTWPLDAIQ